MNKIADGNRDGARLHGQHPLFEQQQQREHQ